MKTTEEMEHECNRMPLALGYLKMRDHAKAMEAKLSERKTVHQWLNDKGTPREENGKPLCLLRRLAIALEIHPPQPATAWVSQCCEAPMDGGEWFAPYYCTACDKNASGKEIVTNAQPGGDASSESQREAAGLADEKPDGQAENVKRMHPYQRGRASITGLMVELRKIIETGRLVGVVMARLVRVLVFGVGD